MNIFNLHAIIYVSNEGYGHSARNWSFQQRVRFALPNRLWLKTKEPIFKDLPLMYLHQGLLLNGVWMNKLLEKYNDYMQLVGCTVKYSFSDDTSIEYIYKEDNFPHLLGLHKLTDIQLIQFWKDRTNKTVKLEDIIRHIKNETFTDTIVHTSKFFKEIEDRYNFFSYENLTTLNYTDAVINFNPKVIGSKLKSDLYCLKKNYTRNITI